MIRIPQGFKNFFKLPGLYFKLPDLGAWSAWAKELEYKEDLDTETKEKIEAGVKVIVERARIVAFIRRIANNKFSTDEKRRMILLLVASYIEKQHHNDDMKLFGPEDKNEKQEDQEESEQS
jgi:hypothetical protein